MSKSINIIISDEEYAYLKRIAIDISPGVYARKYLQKHLLGSLESNGEESTLLKKQFNILKQSLKDFTITQNDIATYFSVSQSCVSYFMKKESKKSILYPKFFIHSTAATLLFDIYIDKYELKIKKEFSEDEIDKIKESLNGIKDTDRLIFIVLMAVSPIKEQLQEDFNLQKIIDSIRKNKQEIQNMNYKEFEKKNLNYLHSIVQELNRELS